MSLFKNEEANKLWLKGYTGEAAKLFVVSYFTHLETPIEIVAVRVSANLSYVLVDFKRDGNAFTDTFDVWYEECISSVYGEY
jgi:hypothetical protein